MECSTVKKAIDSCGKMFGIDGIKFAEKVLIQNIESVHKIIMKK